jgi:hypothetical protein
MKIAGPRACPAACPRAEHAAKAVHATGVAGSLSGSNRSTLPRHPASYLAVAAPVLPAVPAAPLIAGHKPILREMKDLLILNHTSVIHL